MHTKDSTAAFDTAIPRSKELLPEAPAADGIAEFDMQYFIQGVAVDIIGVTTFGQSFQVVENGSHPLPDKALKLSGILQFIPWIRHIPLLPKLDPSRFAPDACRGVG
ncbi:hypothetical protein McanMca71_007350 [Microsporum canis]